MRGQFSQFSSADQDYLQGVLRRHPAVADRLEAIGKRDVEARAKLIPAIMNERLDRHAAGLGIPAAWRQTRSERAHERARMAQWFAPVKMSNDHLAAEWARADEVVRGIADHVIGDAKLGREDRQRIGRLAVQLMFPKDRFGYRKTAARIHAGNSQLARWVGDTGKLQTLHRALNLEAQLPELRIPMDMIWARSGGGQIRSEAGKALRSKLILQRHNLHHSIGQPSDYEARPALMAALAATPGKEQLLANIRSDNAVVSATVFGPIPTRMSGNNG